jgi:hypothetical protein
MMVVSYFAHLKESPDYVNSDANSKRIDALSWMIENLKLDGRNYNSFLSHTRHELDATIYRYKPCLVQNNWKMQSFLDTNLGVRRQNAQVRHNRNFETREEAIANELVLIEWWKDSSTPDVYLGGTPKTADVNPDTLKSHSEFLRSRRSRSLPRGGALDDVTRMAMEGMRRDERCTDRQTRRRSHSRGRQTEETMDQTQSLDDMRMNRDHYTEHWTMQMETDFLNPRMARHAASNKHTWDSLNTAWKNLIRMTYRTAMGHPISNSEEQANHFGSHLKGWMATRREYHITSEEYWRIANLLKENGPGYIHTRPCKWYTEGSDCRLGDTCKHMHVRQKSVNAGQAKHRRER